MAQRRWPFGDLRGEFERRKLLGLGISAQRTLSIAILVSWMQQISSSAIADFFQILLV